MKKTANEVLQQMQKKALKAMKLEVSKTSENAFGKTAEKATTLNEIAI